MNTIPRGYVVTIRLQKRFRAPHVNDPVERVETIAYDYDEAIMQAMFALDAKLGGIDTHRLSMVVITIEPNCEPAAALTMALLRDISLAILQPQGRAS